MVTWLHCAEIGDGSCGFRALARRIFGHPDMHIQVRQDVVQYLSGSRAHPNFQMAISAGIGLEHIYILGAAPVLYPSYDHYLQIMSPPSTYMREPEIVAARLKYERQIEVTVAGTPMPNPQTADS